ncbi:hypothetical protein [Pyramidobacter sp.]|uniref:hypothetical protein n=1 Tax=Pyramidobacter sp. TaxID=1943581 RepID=UPI002A82956B|nr:hypothetical protein [Pyramidobacter sp.]
MRESKVLMSGVGRGVKVRFDDGSCAIVFRDAEDELYPSVYVDDLDPESAAGKFFINTMEAGEESGEDFDIMADALKTR